MRGKRKEGRPLPETADMKLWRKEFDEMSLDEHHNRLKSLGLNEEDLKEFDEDFKGNGAKKKGKQDSNDF